MKSVSRVLFGAIVVVAASQFGASALAQDAMVAGAPIYKRVLLENAKIRVMEAVFKPGDTIATHSHPDHFVYVASGGTLRIWGADGKFSDVTAETGQALWLDAQSHTAKNIGTTEIKLVVTELKPAPKEEKKTEEKPAGK